MQTDEAVLYWIHLSTHTDILQEGYIGVTKFPEKRLSQHRNKTNIHFENALKKYDDIVFSILLRGDEDYCYMMENKVRSQDFIGWNMQAGGKNPQLSRIAAAAMKGKPFSEEHKQALRGKRPHVIQSGANNNFACPILVRFLDHNTKYESITDFSIESGIDRKIIYRIIGNCDKHDGNFIPKKMKYRQYKHILGIVRIKP